ncbi:E3 ubiquitin-protein ligase MIB2-like [Ruditapes philippinarum]|uniref:E3 ubiquitin-protein ligase MIB2-like n=1 Tax=Ruditapes philippinarum TaxID=129788 RepID=UPI00295C30CC|nr:E3 ubiquitin-protein ligase MIB2-like [Ruditapes philippinarum]
MSVEGVRVVRGPDWSYGDDDGGEGHVGTVTQDNEDDTVEVQWDMGNCGTYNTGSENKCDLRILDSAPAGLKHNDTKCDECSISGFPGTRWKCQSCPDFDLCSPCYFGDKHNIQHPFLRIDAPGLKGEPVSKRSISTKMRALGMFKGSTVRRGVDWNYGNQDGGDGKTGSIIETNNYGSSGPERDSVKVKWPNKESNSYRVGYRGKVDLVCVEQTPGMDFYKDHLFALNTKPMAKRTSMILSKRQSVVRSKSVEVPKLQIGDNVCVDLPEVALKEVQRGHGGWSMRMKEYIGQHGTLKRFEDNGDCVISYDGKEWRFNANAVRQIPSLSVGDIVRIIDDSDKVQALQKRHGGWQTEMESALGKVGKVVKIDSDGDVAVSFGSKAWVFNAACLIPAPGEKVSDIGGGSGGGERGRLGSGAGAGTGRSNGGGGGGGGGEARGGATGGSTGGGGRSDSDRDVDEASEALGHLIAQLFLLRGLQGTVSPQLLISAAAKNDVSMVQRVLKDSPALIDKTHQGLTALIISSHEGHKDVVNVLLKAGANKDLTESKGNTALMAALMKKREEIAMILIDAGANVHLVNSAARSALHFAASNGCNTTLRALLGKGVDVNKQDIAGDTPIHDAILNKNDSAVSFLVADPKINLRICNKKGHSPLHLAAMKDDEISVSRILAKAPELKNARKSEGYTPLHVAAINDNKDVIKTLLKAHAVVDSTDGNNITPLHLAAHQGYIAATQLLVEAGADVNFQDKEGDTPLHVCCMGNRSGRESEMLARLLLGISSDGEKKERVNVACFLIQKGANWGIRNGKGRTALECCSDGRMRNVIKQFADKHGKPSSSGASQQQRTGASLLQELFSDLPLPCMGCMQKIADTKFVPCGHKVCCARCSFRVRECPMCDRTILERYDLEGRRLVLQDPCKVQ